MAWRILYIYPSDNPNDRPRPWVGSVEYATEEQAFAEANGHCVVPANAFPSGMIDLDGKGFDEYYSDGRFR